MGSVSLSGRRVLVTGAAGGVGKAITARLVAEGAKLLIADRNGDALERVCEEVGGRPRCATFAADLSRGAAVAELFNHLDRELGGLDILVACAGIGSAPLMDFEDESWRDVLESNLMSYVGCTRQAVERIRRGPRGTGSIILLGSISIHIKAVGESVYNAAKGGVASFAETLRKELIPDEIRVTLIEPGAISSTMQPFDAAERARRTARQQLLPPEEVADAIMFAATRPRGVDCVTLRIEPMDQKIC